MFYREWESFYRGKRNFGSLFLNSLANFFPLAQIDDYSLPGKSIIKIEINQLENEVKFDMKT